MFYIDKTVYIKVWKIDLKEKYADIRFSTSEKDNREDGKYINSSWFGRCVGKAFNQIKNVAEKDTVKIIKAKITAEQYKDKEGNSKYAPTRVTIFEFDDSDSNSKIKEKKENKETNDDVIPFF